MTPEQCMLCGADAKKLEQPRAGRTGWTYKCTTTDGKHSRMFTMVDSGEPCLWYACNGCLGAFHTETWRDRFAKLDEKDAKKAMELFLGGNPSRWPLVLAFSGGIFVGSLWHAFCTHIMGWL